MRCLHCGKDIPLFKRLSGGEFCSEAHRRDYHQEYSQLALNRLMQAGPQPNGEKNTVAPLLVPKPALPTPPLAPTNGHAPSVSKMAIPLQAATPPASAQANGNVTVTDAPPIAHSAALSAPKMANVVVQKPAAALPEVVIMALPESETLLDATALHRPTRQASLPSAELLHATPAPWQRTCEIQNPANQRSETRLELRNYVRSSPVIDIGLRIGGTKAWRLADQPTEIPAARNVSPADAPVWHAPSCDFPSGIIALHDLLEWQLPEIGKEDEVAKGGTPQLAGVTEQDWKPLPPVALPGEWKGITAGKAKPAQIFQSWIPNQRTAQTGAPEALPLRPVMVLISRDALRPQMDASVASGSVPEVPPPAVSVRPRKAEVSILPPEKPLLASQIVVTSARPDPPPLKSPVSVSVSEAGSVKRDNLGLPEFRMQPSGAEIAARIWTKVARFRGRKETPDGGR
jgi:hypothetical protein